MSNLAVDIPPVAEAVDQPTRALAVDSMVHAHRAATPPELVVQRGVPRLSISELNASDPEEIRQRFLSTRMDDRGPLTRLLDLIDLPRNTIANVVAPSIAARKQVEGETGTFGMGVVHTSDILDSLGVHNHIARAVGGFVGDTLLDPLTYAGPAGWGLELGSGAGKVARVARTGRKALLEGVDAASKGRNAADPLVHEIMESRGLYGKSKDAISTELLGSAKESTSPIHRILGGDRTFSGASALADDLHAPAVEAATNFEEKATLAGEAATSPERQRQIDASRAFFGHYGPASNPGLRFGIRKSTGKFGVEWAAQRGAGDIAAGTGIAHIPWPLPHNNDIGIYIPALGDRAIQNTRTGLMATARAVRPDLPPEVLAQRARAAAVDNRVAAISGLIDDLNRIDQAEQTGQHVHTELTPLNMDPAYDVSTRAWHAAGEEDAAKGREWFNFDDKASDGAIDAYAAGRLGPVKYAEHLAARRAGAMDALKTEQDGLATALTDIHAAAGKAASNPLTTPGELAWHGKLLDAAAAKVRQLSAEAETAKSTLDTAKNLKLDLESNPLYRTNQLVEQYRAEHAAAEASHKINWDASQTAFGTNERFPATKFDEPAAYDRAASIARAEYLATVDDNARKLFGASDATMQARQAMVDGLHARVQAAQEYANAVGAPLNATLKTRDRALLAAANSYLFRDPETLGYHHFTPLKTVASMVFGDEGLSAAFQDRMDTWDRNLKRVFGSRTGTIHEAQRAWIRSKNLATNDAAVAINAEAERDILSVLNRHGMGQSEYSKAGELVQMMRSTIQDAKQALPWPGDAAYDGLRDAAKGGILDDALHPGIAADLMEVASKWNGRVKEQGLKDVAERRLNALADGYVERNINPIYQQQIASQMRNFARQAANPGLSDAARARAGRQLEALETFQKQRTMNEYRFEMPTADGTGTEEKRFLDAHRIYQTYSPEDMAQIGEVGTPQRDAIEDLRRTMKYHDGLVAKAGRGEIPKDAVPVSRPLTAAEINKRVSSGELSMFTGSMKTVGNGFFDLNAASNLAARFGASERSRLAEQLKNVVESSEVHVADYKLARSNMQTGEFVTKGGVTGRAFKMGNQQYVQLGGERFRTLNPDALKMVHDAADLFYGSENGFVGQYFPERIAEKFEAATAPFRDDGAVEKTFKGLDSLMKYWKTSTLFHTSRYIVDLTGEVINAINSGIWPHEMIPHAGFVSKVMRAKTPEELAALKTTVAGREMNGAEFIAQAGRSMNEQGAVQAAFNNQLIDGTYQAKARYGFLNTFKSPQDFKASMSEMSERAGRWTDAAADANRLWNVPYAKQAARTKRLIVDEAIMGKLVGPAMKVDADMLAWVRGMAHLALMERGHTADTAGNLVREGMLDFTDLTHTEDAYLRRLFPFYCVPDHSEALTRRGWVRHDNLLVGEEVLTYSKERDCLEWQPCLDIAVFDCDQPIKVIQNNRGLRLESTDNHRWIVRGKGSKPNRFVESHELKPGHSLLMTAEFKGTDSALTPDQARLLGWLLTDGYWRFRSNRSRKGESGLEACLYQTKHKFIDEARRMAGGHEQKPHPQSGQIQIAVLRERLVPLLPFLRRGKHDPSVARIPCLLSREAAEAMYDAMYKADGTTSKHPGSVRAGQHFACRTKPYIKDCFRLLAFMLGKRTTPNSERGCYVSDNRVLKIAAGTVTNEPYFGKVWCPRTPNGTWVMRQNDSITITGNTWMRASSVYTLKQMLRNPKYLTMAPKVRDALEEAADGDGVVPEHLRPKWMREQMAMQIGSDPQSRSTLSVGTMLPSEQGAHAVSALLSPVLGASTFYDFLAYMGNSINPVIKSFGELAGGREWFTHRTIGFNENEGDLSVPEYVAGQFRPFRELGTPGSLRTGPLPAAYGRSVGEGVARTLIGGRSQPFTEDRRLFALKREFDDKMSNIRKRINLAEREGNKDASLKARVALLQLIADAQRKGLAVPKALGAQADALSHAQPSP